MTDRNGEAKYGAVDDEAKTISVVMLELFIEAKGSEHSVIVKGGPRPDIELTLDVLWNDVSDLIIEQATELRRLRRNAIETDDTVTEKDDRAAFEKWRGGHLSTGGYRYDWHIWQSAIRHERRRRAAR